MKTLTQISKEILKENYILGWSKEEYDKLTPYEQTMQVSGEQMGRLVKNIPKEEIEKALEFLKNFISKYPSAWIYEKRLSKLEKALKNKEGFIKNI